jgi:hypothetical protein
MRATSQSVLKQNNALHQWTECRASVFAPAVCRTVNVGPPKRSGWQEFVEKWQ